MSNAADRRAKANAETLARLNASDPVLVDVRPAGEVVPGMTPDMVLTSGRPMGWADYTGGQRQALIYGAVFEGLAKDEADAAAKFAAGRIKIGDLVIDAVAVEAAYRGRALKLPRQEFQLLKFLAERPGRVFSREQLLSRVWGYRYAGGTRTVDIHVRRLRAKLGPGSAMIETVRHVGYKLRAPGAGVPT